MPNILNLTVADYKDAHHWYWRLTSGDGHFLADAEVKLNRGDAEFDGFLDLADYLSRTVPGGRRADQVRRIDQVGDWIGRNVYGAIGEKILDSGTPAIVRVQIPPDPKASGLLYRPWELGHARGRPLALQDVTLVFEVQGEAPAIQRVAVGESLRVLAVFSLPVGLGALNLRHERYCLTRLIRGIAQRRDLAIDLRVLQYGVTREALAEILEEGEGWDIVHFSGHGLEAHLVLEKADGSRDLVPSDQLVNLLKPARGRLKWVTLSACLSAASTVQETLHWLGVEPHRATIDTAPARGTAQPLPAVARALVQNLDCAVVAMRYPVGDQFAIDLGQHLYQGVLERKQPLTRALQLAIPDLTRGSEAPVLSVATPALFGRYAAELSLKVPRRKDEEPSPGSARLDYFPDPAPHFVGRVDLLAKASAALAPESQYNGVLFYGMAGGGKTACALELAYHYEDLERFTSFVWFQAPPEGHDIASALVDFGSKWDLQLSRQPGRVEFSLLALAAADEKTFEGYLPRLSGFLERRSILIVLDNIESLLRDNGKWREPRWDKLITALLKHQGQSRLVLTSRARPQPAPDGLLQLPVHSLSLDEAALLARQLPNLGRLIREASSRPLVLRTLKLVQGHPELIKLAEAQASDSNQLTAHVDRAEAASVAGEAELEAFFRTGNSVLDAPQFLEALGSWTRSVSEALPEGPRAVFHFLCCIEESDREQVIVQGNWADFWKRIGMPGDPPDPVASAEPLRQAGLVDVVPQTENAIYRIHPGVAEAGRELAAQQRREAADIEMGAWWDTMFWHAYEQEGEGGGGMILRAGLSAAPYLMRQMDWRRASVMLEQVVNRDKSPATVAEVLPLLQRIAAATKGTDKELVDAGVLAKTLANAARVDEALKMMQDIERQAVQRGDYRVASTAAGYMVDLLKGSGRFDEALEVVKRKQEHTRNAGLGPWTQLADTGRILQIQVQLGQYDKVLAAVNDARETMRHVSDVRGNNESLDPWNVREGILDVGRSAALRLEKWEEALSLNLEGVDVRRNRGATSLELARTRFNDYAPLLRLRRYPEAHELLQRCRAVFEQHGALDLLGNVYSALADLEDKLSHRQLAIDYEKAALRYSYAAGDPQGCAISHFNIANNMRRADADQRIAVAHRLASAVIAYQTGDGRLSRRVDALRRDLASFAAADPPLPASFDELCGLVEQTEGVRFRDLFSRLPTDRAATGDEALQKVLELARGRAAQDPV